MADNEQKLLDRITWNPEIFGGKPIIRGHRLAVEHVLGMLAAGDSADTILEGYPWMEKEDVQACLVYARRPIEGKSIRSFDTIRTSDSDNSPTTSVWLENIVVSRFEDTTR